MGITFVKGDATRPLGDGPRIIAHVSNDQGGWGAGFVLAISKRWREPEATYRRVARTTGLPLGDVQFVEVGDQIVVANMIAQVGYGRHGTPIPLRYDALRTCLMKVAAEATRLKASVHCPRIGCGLSGGRWGEVEKIITDTLLRESVPVTVYDLP